MKRLLNYMSFVLRVLRTSCCTCSYASRVSCFTRSRDLLVSCPRCSLTSCASCPTWFCAQRALGPHVMYLLLCLTYVLPHMLSCLSGLIYFRPLIPNLTLIHLIFRSSRISRVSLVFLVF